MIVFFEVSLFLMIFFEYRRYKTMITPMCLLGTVYFLAFPTIYLLHQFMDIHLPTDFNLFMTLVFFLMVFAIGQFCRVPYFTQGKIIPRKYQQQIFDHIVLIWTVFLIGLICKIISFFQVVHLRGLGNMKRGEFGIFANLGYLAHVTSPFIYFLGLKKKQVLPFILIGVELFILLLFEVKGTLLLVVVHVVLFVLMMDVRFSFGKTARKALVLGVLAVAVFIFIYAYIPKWFGSSKNSDMVNHAFQEFVHYLFSPFICANGFYKMPAGNTYESGYRVIFNPVLAIYERFLGQRNYPDTIIHDWPPMSEARGANVGGIFSESVYQIGYTGAFIYVAIIAFFVYLFFHSSHFKGRFFNGTSALLTRWVLCFFGNYMAPSTASQILVYCFVFDLLIMTLPVIHLPKVKIIGFHEKIRLRPQKKGISVPS